MSNKAMEKKDAEGAGITTPTITREQAVTWGMLYSEFYKFSCLVREVLSWPLGDRQRYVQELERKHGAESARVEEFKRALKFEFSERKKSEK